MKITNELLIKSHIPAEKPAVPVVEPVKVEAMTLSQFSQQTDVTLGIMLAKLEEHEQRLAKLEKEAK